MVLKHLKNLGAILGIAYFTYVSHYKIERTINTMRFFYTESEQEFVEKEQALDLRLIHEKNGTGNLETYVKSYNKLTPLFQKKEGLVLGNPHYNFANFTTQERDILCKEWNENKDNLGQYEHFLGKMFEIWGRKHD